MKKKLLLFLIIIMSLLLVGCGKKEEKVEEKSEEKQEEIVETGHKIAIVASCGYGNVCFFDKDFNMVSNKAIGNNYYYDVYDYNLYYEKGNIIYKYDLETEKEEKLDIKIENEKNKTVIFRVDGDYLYYALSFEKGINIINMKDGTKNKIDTDSYMLNFDVTNGKIYYKNNVSSQKCLYCLIVNNISNNLKIINERIDATKYNNDYILYKTSSKYFLYNMKDDTKEEIHYSFLPHIYKDTAYGIDLSNLVDLKTNEKIYEFKFEDGEELKDFSMINKTKLIALIKSNTGTKYYIYDLEKNTREEYTENRFYKSDHTVGFEFVYVE